MRLVLIGKITRPHGFRGSFVVHSGSGRDSVLGTLAAIYLGEDPTKARRHEIVEAAWMPRGWKLQVKEIQTEALAKQSIGLSVYGAREDFPPLAPGEYYADDLVGMSVLDASTGSPIGRLASIENSNEAGDRWWCETPKGLVAIPARTEFVRSVDTAAGEIRVVLPREDDP